MSNDFCYSQSELDEAAGVSVSTEKYTENVDWERRVQGRGTKVWWHRNVYEGLKNVRKSEEKMPEPVNVSDVQQCKVLQVHPNFKWVETDKGRVWVGMKGATMKRGQVIQVLNGELFTGKTERSACLVRV